MRVPWRSTRKKQRKKTERVGEFCLPTLHDVAPTLILAALDRYLSWALDTNEEERAKGKTVECGKATFHTEKKHYTIIDAPGHKSFVPSMITGAVQADVAILVISTRTGEFEAGFERGGQTREHAMLAKSVGVKKLVVVMNKMDLCEWSESRYLECQKKLLPFLKSCGFNPKTDIHMMPLSGQMGLNLTKPLPDGVCPWYTGPCLVEYLDSMEPIKRYVCFSAL